MTALDPRLLAVLCVVLLGPFPAFADDLPSWSDGDAKRAILSFVAEATAAGTTSYVEPAARVAVFDFDGTLTVEKPIYGQVTYCADKLEGRQGGPPAGMHAILRKTRAFERDGGGDLSWEEAAELWGHGLEGASGDEVQAGVRRWFQEALHPGLRRPRAELIFQPMRELIAWLKSRGFRVLVVTGSTRDFVRAISEELLGVAREDVIGSSLKLRFVAPKGRVERVRPYGETVDADQKVLEIDSRIGRRPLMAFGNSDGDVAMLTYATTGPRAGFASLVHHDDAAREYAYDRGSPIGSLNRGLEAAAAHGWRVISMKSDWLSLFAPSPAKP